MSVSKFRNSCYKMGRVLGDFTAIKKGKIASRIGRRLVGRKTKRIVTGIK